MVKVYVADIRGMARREDALKALLDPERQAKAESFRSPADRLRCIAGGLLVRAFVGRGPMCQDARGKPFVEGGKPFSLSHSGDYAALAVAENEVGLDVQKCVKHPSDALARRVLDGAGAVPDADFTAVWAMKESCVKATGEGIGRALRGVSLRRDERGFLRFQECRVTEICCPAGYRMAVCHALEETCPAEAETVECERLESLCR